MGYRIVLGDFEDIHRQITIGRRVEIDTQYTDQQKRRTAHEHKGKFHRRIGFVTATPHSDEKIHRDKSDLIEHEHRKEVDRNKETEYPYREKYQPKEEFFGQRIDFP